MTTVNLIKFIMTLYLHCLYADYLRELTRLTRNTNLKYTTRLRHRQTQTQIQMNIYFYRCHQKCKSLGLEYRYFSLVNLLFKIEYLKYNKI